MDIEYVSIEKSRAGSADKPKDQDDAKAPKTSATPAAKPNPGGKSASKTEEG